VDGADRRSAAGQAAKVGRGASAVDATALAKEMRCEREFLQSMQKRQRHTEFACFSQLAC
jgi:hypothetical protein